MAINLTKEQVEALHALREGETLEVINPDNNRLYFIVDGNYSAIQRGGGWGQIVIKKV